MAVCKVNIDTDLRLALTAKIRQVFAEKPVACDAPNIRKWFAASDESVKKGLNMVAGTQRRHQAGYLETVKRIRDGAIGDVTEVHAWTDRPVGGDPWSDFAQMARPKDTPPVPEWKTRPVFREVLPPGDAAR